MKSYLQMRLKSHWGLLLFSGIFLSFFMFMVLYFVQTFDTAPIISVIVQQLPPPLKAFLTRQVFTLYSPIGTVAFTLSHPMLVVISCFVALQIPTGQVAGEAEGGTLELLLACPVSRSRYILRVIGVSFLFNLVPVAGALLGVVLGVLVYSAYGFPLILQSLPYLVHFYLFISFASAMALAFSVFTFSVKKSIQWAAGILLVGFLLNFLSTLWPPLAVIQPINPYNYYQPQQLLNQPSAVYTAYLVFTGTTLALLALGYSRFLKRDL